MRTFDTSELMPQLPKACNHRVVLHALPLLAAKPPAVGQANVFGAVAADAAGGALAPPTQSWAGRSQVDRIRAASKNGRDGRVWGAGMFLDDGGDGDALRDHQRDGVDGDGDGAASVLHPRGNSAVLEGREPGRLRALHGCGGLRIATHGLRMRRAALKDRCRCQAAVRLAWARNRRRLREER